jgi:ribose 5-phosphate isomerase B
MAKQAIAIASDLSSVELREKLVPWLKKQGYKVLDLGASIDYPDMAAIVARTIKSKKAERAILVCRTGIGMSIAANRFPFIRAALLYSTKVAKLAREHTDANVAVLAIDSFCTWRNKRFIKTFLTTKFSGLTRHSRRIAKLAKL